MKGTVSNSLDVTGYLNLPRVRAHYLHSSGHVPNNRLPLLVYARAVRLAHHDPARIFEELFEVNGWEGSWRNGIYSYHHYHSNTHEVLGIYSGSASVQFGGDQGIILKVQSGDAVIIPAGVAHKNLGASEDLGVVGAYPGGAEPNMHRAQPNDRPKADQAIAEVGIPESDPVFGKTGPLLQYWNEQA